MTLNKAVPELLIDWIAALAVFSATANGLASYPARRNLQNGTDPDPSAGLGVSAILKPREALDSGSG